MPRAISTFPSCFRMIFCVGFSILFFNGFVVREYIRNSYPEHFMLTSLDMHIFDGDAQTRRLNMH